MIRQIALGRRAAGDPLCPRDLPIERTRQPFFLLFPHHHPASNPDPSPLSLDLPMRKALDSTAMHPPEPPLLGKYNIFRTPAPISALPPRRRPDGSAYITRRLRHLPHHSRGRGLALSSKRLLFLTASEKIAVIACRKVATALNLVRLSELHLPKSHTCDALHPRHSQVAPAIVLDPPDFPALSRRQPFWRQ